MAETPVSTTREDWVRTALQILVEEGAAAVKIMTLAKRMGCSRSNFYWFFKDREALLAELLAYWQARNTAAIIDRAARPAARISQGVLNIFDCWANPDLFDARLDFAVREWARRSAAVAAEVGRADSRRLDAIAALFTRFGASPTQAIVRARTLYFMQLGYYALDISETPAQRMALLSDYVLAFCGERPADADKDAFARRNLGSDG
ncbi:TetR/AcrR family transcriptional regulator [Paragemmobacter straminiformis]|uniref:TetR/AcrR family transcriptional regulator n=1 Tax=Paragemmobacter straminiformis TaxID=2045119 RepID=A0A842IEX4_9RHOB|nr:TetR/AcrR family transcriptional regulator [Gemmobacter straminiformis]MBC2837607.1 TetR/AcrR family transcriptional regulator [Gemmobacter straminiformis]